MRLKYRVGFFWGYLPTVVERIKSVRESFLAIRTIISLASLAGATVFMRLRMTA